MTRGRKATEAPEIIEPDLDQGRIDNAVAVMRETAMSDEIEIRAGVYRLGQLVGARQMALAAASFLRAADIQLFEEISKSKGYKHIPLQCPDGNLRPAETIQEFCRLVFRTSYSVLAEHRKALQELGTECYEAATSLGLPRTQLRLLLALPEDERKAVEEAMRDGGKDEVVTLIQSLANKLDEARAEVEELKGELKATEDISSDKTQRIEKLLKEQRRIQAAAPDQVMADLYKEATAIANDARGALVGNLRQAITAVLQHHETHGGDGRVFLGGLVGQLFAELTTLRAEFDLPEVDTDDHGWLTQD